MYRYCISCTFILSRSTIARLSLCTGTVFLVLSFYLDLLLLDCHYVHCTGTVFLVLSLYLDLLLLDCHYVQVLYFLYFHFI